MSELKVVIGQMSTREAAAWIDAIVEKYGTDIVYEVVKMREHKAAMEPKDTPND